MALVTLTTEQRIQLKNNQRFQSLFRTAVLEEARYTSTLPGDNITTPQAAEDWAKKRYLSVGLMNNPLGGWTFNEWLEQAWIVLAGMAVYDDANAYDEEEVVDYMRDNNKFTELAGLVFTLRMKTLHF